MLRIEDLGPKAGSKNANKVAGAVRFGTILPKKYSTLGVSFCQWKIGKIAGAA